MQTVTVVGAGFSGLVTAYYLVKEGINVRVVEKSSRVGGLLQTIRTEHGLVETAANGIRNSARLEAMCTDIGVRLQTTRREGRARFMHRGKPRQWPLTPSDSLALTLKLAANATRLRPRQFETIAGWGQRVIGRGATEYLLAPALGGIYAGDPKTLSASLILRRASLPSELQVKPGPNPKHRGTVAPTEGMQQLIDGLFEYLERSGVDFIFDHVG
ncbi:MAG TPA: FAD-dependent oxidoreductase, partial [Pyrinomonadaceae bacterium]|nr:FAD-dependent oxidoreductase [Pyrinomonadaceae bacterium]